MLNLTFSDNIETKKFILEVFNKTIDADGFIIDIQTKKRIIDSEGQQITIDEFGGIVNGSEIFFKNNIISLVDLYTNVLSKRK